METVKTLCPYCGVGCGLEVIPPIKPDQPWKVKGDRAHPSSQGMVCVKGATVIESIKRDRLLYPMMRETLDAPFARVSWDEALETIVKRIQNIRDTSGVNAICMYGSGQFITEDYYTAQKLMKGCIGTNNFDANSRLCMSSAVSGYIQSFGSDGPPCCYDDLELTDCAFIIGSNTAECHPIIFNRLAKYHKKNDHVKMIVVDPRKTPTAEVADLHLAIRPGSDIDLLNGIAHLLLKWGDIHAHFIDECTVNFRQFCEVIQYYTPEIVAERCGISETEIEQAARYWQESKRILSLWSMGINQSSEGTAKVRAIINLHLMTGQIGKPGCGPFSLTGQPNAMGGREAGGLAHILPGYRLIKNAKHRAEIEEYWGLKPGSISPEPGLTAWEMITGLETGEVEFLWIAATNPVVSMPDLERTKAALSRSRFTVYQEAYYPTETSAYAHLLLPARQWSEKTGVMTNSERRVTLCTAFQEPEWEAKEDWRIFAEVGKRLGFTDKFAFETSADVYREFVELTRDRPCDMTGISHEKLQKQGPLQWPFPETRKKEEGRRKKEEAQEIEEETRKKEEGGEVQPGLNDLSKRLYTDGKFNTPDGKARFSAYHSRGLAEPPDRDYPFVLTTGRLYGHWHTLTRTGRIEKIKQMHPNPFIEIHPKDAKQLNIQEGDLVKVCSRRGETIFPAKVTSAIAPATVFVPMHWGALWAENSEANALTHPEACPDSKQPELKACAVKLMKI